MNNVEEVLKIIKQEQKKLPKNSDEFEELKYAIELLTTRKNLSIDEIEEYYSEYPNLVNIYYYNQGQMKDKNLLQILQVI